MTAPNPTDERYPIGPQPSLTELGAAERSDLLGQLAALPAEFRAAFAGLSDAQLDTPYRAGGWTLRQLAHHVPDSHMNAYIRTKLALTEDRPTIKPYDQNAWAELPDRRLEVGVSLTLLDALHARWVALLGGLDGPDWARVFIHPEYGREYSLDDVLTTYAWHGRHHTAQVLALRGRQGW
jgi:uncharacterized damage-inducible protein DinB